MLSLRIENGAAERQVITTSILGVCGQQASLFPERSYGTDMQPECQTLEVSSALSWPLHRAGRDTAAFQSRKCRCSHPHTKCPRMEGAQVAREGSPGREPGYVTHTERPEAEE